jgi:hypothetical protein
MIKNSKTCVVREDGINFNNAYDYRWFESEGFVSHKIDGLKYAD